MTPPADISEDPGSAADGVGADWRDLALGQFRRIADDLTTAIDRVPAELLDRRPWPGANSAGWLIWHTARGLDRNLSELLGVPQLWVADGWAARSRRPADPADTGYGHTPEAAAAFRSPDPGDLKAYAAAACALAEAYLAAAHPRALDTTSVSPTLSNICTVAQRLIGLLADSQAHLGQLGLFPDCLTFPGPNGFPTT
jgi:hypothetical protein